MKVAIVGCRDDYGFTLDEMLKYIPSECNMIISGGAVGIDTMAESAAKALNLPVTVFKPNYKKFGRSAPLRRNKEIANACDMLLAFWDYRSRGTGHTLKYCVDNNIPYKVIPIIPVLYDEE